MAGRERLLAILAAMSGRRVAVLADLVADEYIWCRTSRISREAPAALILRDEGREVRAGGGANAISNLRALGAEVLAVGAVGNDAAGEELLRVLDSQKVDTSGIVIAEGYRTVVKSRVLTSYHHSIRQQVLRIDREDVLDPERAGAALHARMAERLTGAEALLLSDYGYGAVAPALAAPHVRSARAAGMPVTVDSRYRILEHTGVTAATPNEPEVEEALGVTIGDDLGALAAAGATLRARLGAEAVVITRGSEGMALFAAGATGMELIPVFGSDEVADVTGAGDTVVATYTLALAAGASASEAAHLANIAGGIVVTKMGTATVRLDELRAAVAAPTAS